MDRGDLQRLTKEELIELVLCAPAGERIAHHIEASKPLSSEERPEKAKSGGAKPCHDGHSSAMSERF